MTLFGEKMPPQNPKSGREQAVSSQNAKI